MANIFISYAREDTAFVRRLNDALKEREKTTWVDWEGIPPSADWRKEIYAAIEAADTVVFVISPDSAESVVCGEEVGYAISHNKRLIPIFYRDPQQDKLNDQISSHNWIFFRERQAHHARLVAAQRPEQRSGLRIPDSDLLVPAARCQQLSIRTEGQAGNRSFVGL
jgi:hypothetical protein